MDDREKLLAALKEALELAEYWAETARSVDWSKSPNRWSLNGKHHADTNRMAEIRKEFELPKEG